jgi:L-threonylcarbamoyladenylate synthase
VLADLGERIDLILDAGPAPIGIESSIVDVTRDGPPVLLRPGGVPLEALRAVVGGVMLHQRGGEQDDLAAQPAPGLLSKHYSPRARMLVVGGGRVAARARLRAEIIGLLDAGRRVGALLVAEDADLVAGLPVTVGWLGSEADLEQVATRLFAAMRSVDASGVEVIGARSLGESGLGLAIFDRLTRAAAGHVLLATSDEAAASHKSVP